MAAKKTVELDFQFPGKEKKSKRPSKNFTKIFLIASACVLVAALAIAAVLLLGNQQAVVRVMDFGTALGGVSVGGVDVSGMTREEALAATASLEAALLDNVKISLDVNKEIHEFGAADINATTDYISIINQAMDYGHYGTFDERKAAAQAAKAEGVKFEIKLVTDEAALKTALAALKDKLDTPAKDATATFAPWGYTSAQATDGTVTNTPVTFDTAGLVNMCSVISKDKEYKDMPERVLIPDSQMPNSLRFEYWNDRKSSKSEKAKGGYGNRKGAYEEQNVPRDWNVSRFIYTEEVTGLIVDVNAIESDVKSQLESGVYETIAVPVEVTPAAVTLEQIKNQTQLVASWSSSYGGSGHKGDYSRNYNVAMMASLLNGSVIEPGQTWSLNERAGKRSKSSPYRWKDAAGIENGAYTPQPGGGVCQLGSTTYNAAIRSGLTPVEHNHHSIPSGYVPLGLDATINSSSLDLTLRNDSTTALYMVTYLNPSKQYVTVEFYGVPLTDTAGQQIIYTFTNKYLGEYGSPTAKVIEVVDGYKCKDDQVISYDPARGKAEHVYAESRRGTKVMAYRITMTLDGTQLNKEDFEQHSYPVINGIRYIIDPKVVPTPTLPPPTLPPTEEPPAG